MLGNASLLQHSTTPRNSFPLHGQPIRGSSCHIGKQSDIAADVSAGKASSLVHEVSHRRKHANE